MYIVWQVDIMNIEKLKGQRRHNVQEQNAITEHGIFSEAAYWRKNGLPKGLVNVIENHDVNVEKCIVLNYQQDFPGCSSDGGFIVTEDGRFIEFDIDLSDDRERLIELYLWDEFIPEINKSKRGIGATWGYLALKVLGVLNGK